MKKKYDIIILLDHEFRNATDIRVSRTACMIRNNGFSLCIVAYNSVDLPKYELIDDVEIFRIIPAAYSRPRSIFRLRNNVSRMIESKFDTSYLFCVDHRMLDLGCRIKKINSNVKLIYDAHEYLQSYQPQFSKNDSFFYQIKSIGFRTWEKKLEKKNAFQMSLLCTISDSFASLYKNHFRFSAPVLVIRNVSEFLRPDKPFRDAFPEYYKRLEEIKEKKNIIYFGNFYRYLNGIECLFESLKILPLEVSLILVGTNKDKSFFSKYFNDVELKDRMLHIERLPHSYLKDISRYAHVACIPTMRTEFLQTTLSLPNKLFDSIAAELPVICTDLEEHCKIIEFFGNGVTYNGSDWNSAPVNIKTAFLKIMSDYKIFKNKAQECVSLFSVKNEFNPLIEFFKKNAADE